MLTLYSSFLFLHVTGVILWLGTAATMSLLLWRVTRHHEAQFTVTLLEQIGLVGARLTGPAALLTLLAGIATTLSVGFSFGTLWITWGFAGVLASMVLGAGFIQRTVRQLRELLVAGSTSAEAQVLTLQRRLQWLNFLNLLILFSTVWAMVAKPA